MGLPQFPYLNDRLKNALSLLVRILLHPCHSTSNSITSKLVIESPPPCFPRLFCNTDRHSSNYIVVWYLYVHTAHHTENSSGWQPTVNLPDYLSRASVKKKYLKFQLRCKGGGYRWASGGGNDNSA